MARFAVRKLQFGKGPDPDGEGEPDLPRPVLVKLAARRLAAVREAGETLAVLPGPGEALHALMTHRLDMTGVLHVILDKLGRCDRLRIATLGYSQRCLRTMLKWLDTDAVGELTLLASIF